MKSRTVIIILSSIIVIQMIAGVFIIRRNRPFTGPPLPPFGFMENDPGRRMGMGRHGMMGNRFGRNFCEPDFMRERLSLNQQQVDKISDLNRKFDSEFSVYISRIDPEREKLKELLDSDNGNIDAIRSQLKKIESINTEIHLLRIRQGMEINRILTPEQMDILKNERKLFFEKMKEYRGGRR